MSRGFGGAQFKRTGGPGPQERPFTADPLLVDIEINASHFVVILTDGVYERGLKSNDVVKIVADNLLETNDPGSAAAAVCQRALETRSRDNITVMVVLNDGGVAPGQDIEFTPGPLASLSNNSFMLAWGAMASRAGLTMASAVEQRYELVQTLLKSDNMNHAGNMLAREALEQEVVCIGKPPGKCGDDERSQWFRSRFSRMDAPRHSQLDTGCEYMHSDLLGKQRGTSCFLQPFE